jgi:hypothetical protein
VAKAGQAGLPPGPPAAALKGATMGYWKREYTERRNGKQLFLAEAKTGAPPRPAENEDKGEK